MTDIQSIVLKHWGLDLSLQEETSGVSRSTWNLGGDFWLSRSDARDLDSLQRETRFTQDLFDELTADGASLRVPEVVPSARGEIVVVDEGSAWRVTRNVAGEKIWADDLRTYPALIRALNDLHMAFRKIPNLKTPIEKGVVWQLRHDLNAVASEISLAPVSLAAEWLKSRLGELERLPVGITHGDFNPTNVLYRTSGGGIEVSGILDFEYARPDPVALDYGQLFTMAVCHSGVSTPRRLTEEIVGLLGGRFTHVELEAAMVAYWLDLYLQWHKLSLKGIAKSESGARLLRRLTQVTEYALKVS